MPQALPTLFSPQHLQLDYLQLLDLSKEHIPEVISMTQQEHLEELTRSQSKSKLWFKFRAGRVTGSRLYQVVKTDPHKPALSLLNSVCYPETCQFKSAATAYGCRHEKDALEAYKLQLHSGAHDQPMITPCGFVVSVDKPFIGASPDAFVQCKCCGPGVVEVKCPFCVRCRLCVDTDLPSFCLTKGPDGRLHLKHDHPYYYQCQLQLFVSQRSYCDFVVWTEADVHVERVIEDKPFLDDVIPRAQKFFNLCVLPELLGKWFTRSHGCPVPRDIGEEETEEDDGSWCYCKLPKGGDMVCCEGRGCIKWFHLECLQMVESPRGKWVCPTCHAIAKRGRKRKHM